MARRRRQSDELARSRMHILDAAARAFARAGYRATTMGAIAKEAGYTSPTLYVYFKGKLDIYEELITLIVTEALATYEAREPEDLTFEQRVELLLMRQFALVDRLSDAFAFFLKSASSSEGKPARKKGRARTDEGEQLAQRLIKWMSDATRDTKFDGADPAVLAQLFNGITSAFLGTWAAGGRHRPAADLVPLVVSLFFGGAGALTRTSRPEPSST